MKPKKYSHKLRYFTQGVLYNFSWNNVKVICMSYIYKMHTV